MKAVTVGDSTSSVSALATVTGSRMTGTS